MNITYKHNTISETTLKDFLIYNFSQFPISFADWCIKNEYWCKLSQHSTTFEAWSDSKLIGLVCAYFNPISKTIYIPYVCISKEYSGNKIASHLFNILFVYCKDSEVIRISLEVRENNIAAIALYKKQDFNIAGNKNGKIQMERYL